MVQSYQITCFQDTFNVVITRAIQICIILYSQLKYIYKYIYTPCQLCIRHRRIYMPFCVCLFSSFFINFGADLQTQSVRVYRQKRTFRQWHVYGLNILKTCVPHYHHTRVVNASRITAPKMTSGHTLKRFIHPHKPTAEGFTACVCR